MLAWILNLDFAASAVEAIVPAAIECVIPANRADYALAANPTAFAVPVSIAAGVIPDNLTGFAVPLNPTQFVVPEED